MKAHAVIYLTSAALAALMLGCGPAMAQDAPEAAKAEEQAQPAYADDIVVTAQRREERVQDIPVAITAIGSEQLERAGITSIESVAPRVPSFYFGSFGASRPQLYIRGIGTRSFDPGSESSVGVFVDDVYLGRATGSFGSLKDIERIEVLRGPQGTLYGRNTIGGAINVISKGPTAEFTGDFEAGISNYNGYELMAAVGGPLTSDAKLQFRVAGWRTSREGYQRNLVTGNDFQGLDNYGGRAKLAFVPSDDFKIELSAEMVRDGDGAAFAGFNRGSGPVLNTVTGVTTPANPSSVFLARPGRVPITNPGGFNGYIAIDPLLYRKAETFTGRIEHNADFATLTSITAYRTLDSDETRDLEGSSIDSLNQRATERSNQFTQEFRITSNPTGPLSFGGALDWIVGAFYYRDRSDRADYFLLGNDSAVALLSGGPQVSVAGAHYEIDSYALFGQATLHIGPKFDITVGGRYTRDDKRAIQFGTNTRPGVPLVAVPFTVDNSAQYTSFDPRFVLTYKITPDINVYASYSTGFKSGGFQFVPFSASQANVLFQPEDIKTYEIGFKSEFLNRALRFNVAAYKYDYKNLQVSRIIDLGGGAAASLITNAASSDIKGVEVELLARPSENIDFSMAYGYLDAKYDNYVFNATQNFSGTRMVRAPEHTLNVGAEWRIPTGDRSRIVLRADYSLLDTFFHEPGEANPAFGGATSLTREPSYGLLDLRATYDVGDFRITGYMTNASNQSYRRTVYALGSTASDFPGQPRIYGVKLGYRF